MGMGNAKAFLDNCLVKIKEIEVLSMNNGSQMTID